MIAADSRVPLAAECVLHDLLERHGRERPRATFAVLEDGQNLTYGDMLLLAKETAAGLQALGVRQDDHVLSWLPNGLDALRVWFALNYIGAVYMPLNTGYRGQLLEHAIGLSDAKIVIAHGGSIDCQSQPGVGTVFHIHLPVWNDAHGQKSTPPKDGAGSLTPRQQGAISVQQIHESQAQKPTPFA